MRSIERTNIESTGQFAVFDFNTATATDDADHPGKLSVFPNPAIDVITIQNDDISSGTINMDIYSSGGQLIGQYKLTDPVSTVSVQDLTNGNYFLQFSNEQIRSTQQITKQ